MSLKKLEKCTRILAKLRLNFASIATPISLVLRSNFASIDPKFLQTAPKNRQIVDNFSSPHDPFFRKEAAVAELISPHFYTISFSLKELCIFNTLTIFTSKSTNPPKIFQKPASKNLHC